MIGSTHRVWGLYCGAGLGVAAGWPLWQTAASAVISCATSNGPTSPDGDQTWLAWLDRHRGIVHWPGWPLIVAAIAAPHPMAWAVLSLVAGWTSHLIGDAVFGVPGIPLLPFPVPVKGKVRGRTKTVHTRLYVGLQLPTDSHRQVATWFGTRRPGWIERRTRFVLSWGLIPLALGVIWLAMTTSGPVVPGLSA